MSFSHLQGSHSLFRRKSYQTEFFVVPRGMTLRTPQWIKLVFNVDESVGHMVKLYGVNTWEEYLTGNLEENPEESPAEGNNIPAPEPDVIVLEDSPVAVRTVVGARVSVHRQLRAALDTVDLNVGARGGGAPLIDTAAGIPVMVAARNGPLRVVLDTVELDVGGEGGGEALIEAAAELPAELVMERWFRDTGMNFVGFERLVEHALHINRRKIVEGSLCAPSATVHVKSGSEAASAVVWLVTLNSQNIWTKHHVIYLNENGSRNIAIDADGLLMNFITELANSWSLPQALVICQFHETGYHVPNMMRAKQASFTNGQNIGKLIMLAMFSNVPLPALNLHPVFLKWLLCGRESLTFQECTEASQLRSMNSILELTGVERDSLAKAWGADLDYMPGQSPVTSYPELLQHLQERVTKEFMNLNEAGIPENKAVLGCVEVVRNILMMDQSKLLSVLFGAAVSNPVMFGPEAATVFSASFLHQVVCSANLNHEDIQLVVAVENKEAVKNTVFEQVPGHIPVILEYVREWMSTLNAVEMKLLVQFVFAKDAIPAAGATMTIVPAPNWSVDREMEYRPATPVSGPGANTPDWQDFRFVQAATCFETLKLPAVGKRGRCIRMLTNFMKSLVSDEGSVLTFNQE